MSQTAVPIVCQCTATFTTIRKNDFLAWRIEVSQVMPCLCGYNLDFLKYTYGTEVNTYSLQKFSCDMLHYMCPKIDLTRFGTTPYLRLLSMLLNATYPHNKNMQLRAFA